ncbi:MAG: biotin transporter BioY, partial [Limibacillus sp.]
MTDRALVQIALFAALIAAWGLVPGVAVPGLGVTPFILQNLGIMLAGVLLGWKRGALAVMLFLFLVAIGLPLLSGGKGGLGVFAGPTVGFLLGWIPAAAVTGLIMER